MTDHSVATVHAQAAPLIDLLRHGEPVGGQRFRGSRDDPLSSHGWIQMAHAIGRTRLWQRIITSPLRRCAAFAEHLGEKLAIPVDIEGDFREIDFGDWEGRTVSELWSEVPEHIAQYWQDPTRFTPQNAESLTALANRVVSAWESRVSSLPTDSHYLIITHGGVIRVLLAHILGLPLRNCLRLEIGLAECTRLRLQTAPLTNQTIGSIVFHARQQFS